MRLNAHEIKSRLDLVEYLTSQGVELKAVGPSGEYRGRCPFHADEAPSFQVNRRRGLWHCFGCGAGGDVISFVMQRDGVDFRRALAVLAGQAHETEQRPSIDTGYIFCAAADYWAKCLSRAAQARSYLEHRRIWSEDLAARYGIGFAPGGARTRAWLLKKGFTADQVTSSGLVNGRGLDFFFGRITFPLVESGDVVNVYGRSLRDQYKHSYLPARRDVVFNIDQADSDQVILTEGIIDAMSLVIMGFGNAVSALSVHLTQHQINVLAAKTTRVTIAFDGDDAGAKGTASVAEALRVRGVDARVVAMPAGHDINSLLMAGTSREDFGRILAGA
jgi:DNA primase